MAGISIISNFDLNQSVPIDSRLVASSSVERDAIIYKYSGLKVYQKDINRTWTWNGTGWDAEGSGIYGGSGSIPADTYVSFGTVSNPVTSKSRELIFVGETDGVGKTFLHNNFYRSDNAVSSFEYKDVEFRTQYKYFDGTNTSNGPYIVYNVNPQGTDTSEGGIAFNTGFDTFLSERLRITALGRVGVGTTDPRGNLQIGPTSSAIAKPLVFLSSSPTVRPNSAVIGHNWYPSNNLVQDLSFDQAIGSTKLVFANGIFRVQNRAANSTTYNDTLSVGTNSRVGIMTTTPRTELDVNGTVMTKKLELTYPTGQTSSTYIFSNSIFPYQIVVGGQLVAFSTTSSNYLINTTIVGDLNVVESNPGSGGTISSYGNIVSTNGSITNFESTTNLTPIPVSLGVLYNDTTSTSTNNGTVWTNSIPLSQFQPGLGGGWLSFRAYRVGALTFIDFSFRLNSTLTLSGPFRGFVFKFSNQKFKPVDYGFGNGYVHRAVGTTMSESIPLSVDAFWSDSDYLGFLPLGVTIPTPNQTTAPAEFYIRVRTHNFGSGFGSTLGSTIDSGDFFKGSIVYKSGNF